MTKSIFSRNVLFGNVSVFSSTQSGLVKLASSDPFFELNDYMTKLDLGDLQYLIDNFSIETFKILAVKLSALKTNSQPVYIRLLNYLNSCLTTLLVIEVNVGKEMVILKNEITKLKNENSILYNVELLTQYLQTLTKKTYNIFGEQKSTIAKPKLRPEYALYVERYGFPNNGAFNSEFMAEILKELNLA